MDLKEGTLKHLEKKLLAKENVIGFSNRLCPKICKGVEDPNSLCIRVYVTKKVDKKQLSAEDLIPSSFTIRNWLTKKEIMTDVVEIGEIKALAIDKTIKFRPVELGVSVGHFDITAGSLGMEYTKDGLDVEGSNAHVTTDNPSKEVSQITEKRICQPGPAHDQLGKVQNVAGNYIWHKRIYADEGTSTCPIGNSITSVFNLFSSLLGRKTRLIAIVQEKNYIDFGAYKPIVEHAFKFADDSINPITDKFIGHLFAGSPQSGIICKVKYIMDEGFIPKSQVAEPKMGDTVKGSSFWCNYQTTVMDISATIQVNYGTFNATFYDCIIVYNANVIKGGWSGSGWFLI